ncbi:MAG: tail fiber protein [Bacteroidetes bacterium]|nr:tail fiber protein [Bacteroidota bacterium]
MGGSGGVPSGVICMWSGTIASIPAGWALCDGTNGTPNLNNYFIKGTTVQANMNTTGGANATTLVAGNIPLLTTSNPTITENLYSGILLWQPGFGGFWAGSGGPAAGVTSTFQHTHTVGNASPTAINTQPQYYVLAFIMKL